MTLTLKDINQFINLGNNKYRISRSFSSLKGNIDLSNYNDLQIIIPETVKFIDSYVITDLINTPSHENNNKNIKITFEHKTFEGCTFNIYCFDGIEKFECMTTEAYNTFPKYLTSNTFTVINLNDDKYLKLAEAIKNNRQDILDKLLSIQIIINEIDVDKITNQQILKDELKRTKKINEMLNEIFNL